MFCEGSQSKSNQKWVCSKKKKIPYIFYDNLLFLKDTIFVNTTTSNNVVIDTEKNKEVIEDTHNNTAHSTDYSRPQKKQKVNKYDDVGREFIRILKSNLEKKNHKEDDDHLFFMSLLKEF